MKFSISAAALCLSFAAGPAHAQAPAFPSKPVTIVVPYSPGGGSDNASRAFAKHLSEQWHQPVIVENLAGADGLIGTRRVIKSAPDGYTLLVSIPAIAIMKYTNNTVHGDLVDEVDPIATMASGPTAMVVKGNTEIKTMADLKRVCGKPSANCSWASGEPFTLLAGSGLISGLGLFDSMTNVRYNGTSAAVNDIIGGHVTLLVTGISSVIQHHKTGSLRILGVSTAQRIPDIPDVPTYAEAGLGDVEFTNNWYGLFAPRGTPEAVKKTINDAVRAAARDPAVAKILAPLLITPVGDTTAEFTASLKRDQATVAKLAAKLPPQ
ncbi:tripartite tricarboxylate transporter substrate binding protein [Pigmentiphaga soli]|uniref:Tripartite tricarboxylate transporter substrate binding protein n=1 Tax=Pigmentiphaga soli TaxID=1007095 RepID=A0ABP8H1M0_9BURK